MAGIKELNKRIQKRNPNVTLYKGEGYFYFVYSEDDFYADYSVYVPHFNHQPMKVWIRDFELAMEEFETERHDWVSYLKDQNKGIIFCTRVDS